MLKHRYIEDEIFTWHNFGSMFIKELRKVKSENLKFKTDLRDQVMDGWSVTLYTLLENYFE